jgi:hypothetical protein
MLAQVDVKRFDTDFGKQIFEHHIGAAPPGEMIAVGFAQRSDPGIAMLLVDAARYVAMPTVQTFALCGFLHGYIICRGS